VNIQWLQNDFTIFFLYNFLLLFHWRWLPRSKQHNTFHCLLLRYFCYTVDILKCWHARLKFEKLNIYPEFYYVLGPPNYFSTLQFSSDFIVLSSWECLCAPLLCNFRKVLTLTAFICSMCHGGRVSIVQKGIRCIKETTFSDIGKQFPHKHNLSLL